MEQADARCYAQIYWNKIEPETKSLDQKISEISSIIVGAYQKKEIESQGYTKLSVQERWREVQKNSYTQNLSLHLYKYYSGDKSLLQAIKNDLEAYINKEADKEEWNKIANSALRHSKYSFGFSLLFGGFTLALPLFSLRKSSFGIESNISDEIMAMVIAPTAVVTGLLLCYSMVNFLKSSIMEKTIERRKFLGELTVNIIDNMPDEYFINALDSAKEKITSSS